MSGTGATAYQAWAILKRHARDEIKPLRLQELCRDNDRVSSLVAVYNATPERMLLVDLSRQRMTLETLNHLLRLATARQIKKYITQLAWGQNDPDNPIVPLRLRQSPQSSKTTRFEEADNGAEKRRPAEERSLHLIPSLHLALRAPADQGLEMLTADGTNALTAIHGDWSRLQRISDSMRRGQLPGVTGSMIKDVVVVGRGVPIQALRFIYLALLKDASANTGRRAGLTDSRRQSYGQRRIKFLTSVDPIRAAAVVADLDPASTLVISIALRGNEETAVATRTMKNWLLQSLGSGRRPEVVMSKHMMLVTGSERVAAAHKPESVFLIPEHSRCEAFTTFTAATLLPLSIVFGWSIIEQFLAGAHDLDSHFVETNPRHNIPILMALTDIWNDSLLGSTGRIVTPWTEAFAAYPAFCAALESQVCGISASVPNGSSMVIDGGLHNSYDRALYQSGRVIPSELVMAMDTQISANAALNIGNHGMDDVYVTQDALMCSMFAHLDEMAFGTDVKTADSLLTEPSVDTQTNEGSELSEGNRPSMLVMCGKCDAFTCGQLVALAEHRAVVKARIWDVDPFARETGSSLRTNRTEKIKEELQKMFDRDVDQAEEEDEDKPADGQAMNLSTKTILGHYANMMRDQRIYVVKG